MWAGFRVAGWVLVVSLLLTACQALDYEGQAPPIAFQPEPCSNCIGI